MNVQIRILEKQRNEKGDLFGRLISDLFHSLGYGNFRFNVHKSGREIDLQAKHRIENKIAIGEAKATTETIGGADINKFVGAIDVERRKIRQTDENAGVEGYFVSLSGFKETAVEQENECGNSRINLIGPNELVKELIGGRVLVDLGKAIAVAVQSHNGLQPFGKQELLAHQKGWIWRINFSDNGQTPTHVSLIHAEGSPLVTSLCKEVIDLDKRVGGDINQLILLNKDNRKTLNEGSLVEAKRRYFEYLSNELGEIQFEGLPTDKESGSVKVKLEHIFVPIHFEKNDELEKKRRLERSNTRISAGDLLNRSTKVAILAKPGAGKSTLLKRIAISYAFPERRTLVDDGLPNREYFPIFFRCRELGSSATLSIHEVLKQIPSRAEMPELATHFSTLISSALQNGTALLLIDGLDEIADDKVRLQFANQLRTFISTFPSVGTVVTSREAGFRVVGGTLASYCDHYKVSDLADSEIIELTEKWHKAIIDNSTQTIAEAKKVSELILKDSRIKTLARNPLLLTTLLFVKRWAGYIPTKRTVLYQEMIKLLLVTWNVEGHDKIDIEEAEPQLCFVAYWMTKNETQSITSEELLRCLIDARKQFPEILGYTKISPSEFVNRIESRSSLLILAGHKTSSTGNIVQLYEFLHLSFQEYLTAKAIVKDFIPAADRADGKYKVVRPYLEAENWKEVIPILAVLMERSGKEIVDGLVQDVKASIIPDGGPQTEHGSVAHLLGACLANEVQVAPELLKEAIEWFAKSGARSAPGIETEFILNSKYGEFYRDVVTELLFSEFEDRYSTEIASTMTDILVLDKNLDNTFDTAQILTMLKSSQREQICFAALCLMYHSYINRGTNRVIRAPNKDLERIVELLLNHLKSEDLITQMCITWSFCWAAHLDDVKALKSIETASSILKIWWSTSSSNIKNFSAWALAGILKPSMASDLLERSSIHIPDLLKLIEDDTETTHLLVAFWLLIIAKQLPSSTDIEKIFLRIIRERVPIGVMEESVRQFATHLGLNYSSLVGQAHNLRKNVDIVETV